MIIFQNKGKNTVVEVTETKFLVDVLRDWKCMGVIDGFTKVILTLLCIECKKIIDTSLVAVAMYYGGVCIRLRPIDR